jgi:hypothetical protein
MGKVRWLIVVGVLSLVSLPAELNAQAKAEAENFMEDVVRALFGPGWNVFGHVGTSRSGRFTLQTPVGAPSTAVQRALRSDRGWSFGLGAGVDILLRTGFRLGYTYSKSDLAFRTDNGDGSQVLDMDDIIGLSSHMLNLEVTRYMLPARSVFTPYASAGLVGTWWVLSDEPSTFVVPVGGRTQFRAGALATIGLQGAFNDHFGARLEWTVANVRNPFTGNESFRAMGGVTLDEPTRVNKTDIGLSFVYYFERPNLPGPLRNLEDGENRQR